MVQLTGTKQTFHSDTSIVDASQEEILGSRGMDASGNEYVYLAGVSTASAGSWVTYDEDYATTLLTAGAVGPVAIAMASIDATSDSGWFQIYGVNTVAKTDTIAADSELYIDGTNGRVDDLGVTGDLVIGAYSMTADTSNVATVQIAYPSVSSALGGGGTLTVETPSGDVNDSNTSFTVLNTPLYIVVNGQQYAVGEGQYSSLSTLTITLANPVGSGGFIASWYLA